MALDMRTIVSLCAISYLVCTLFIAQLWWHNRSRFDGLGYWAGNFLLQTLGLGLIASRGTLPDWMSITLANTLLLAGSLSVYIGLERFLHKPGPQWHNYLLLAVGSAALAYFSLLSPDLSRRLLLVSVFLLAFCLQCVWLLWFRVEPVLRPLAWGSGAVFAGYCLISIVRIGGDFFSPVLSTDYFQTDTFQALVLVSYQTLLIALAYSLVVMVNQRLVMGIATQQANFSSAFHQAPYAITLTRLADGVVIDTNRQFEEITGYSRAEVVGQSNVTLHIWEREEDRALVSQTLAEKGRVMAREVNFRTKSGARVVGLLSAEIIAVDGQGEVLSCILDITARKYAEAALHEREAQLETRMAQALAAQRDGRIAALNLMEDANTAKHQAIQALTRAQADEQRLELALRAANQGVYDLNVQTGEAVVTPEYAQMLGYDPATFHETNAAWLARLHPDDYAHAAKAYRDYMEGKTTEYRVEFRQKTQTGDWKWILTLGRLVEHDANGQPLRLLGSHTDITDRKQKEADLQLQARRSDALLDLPLKAETMDESAFMQYGQGVAEALTDSTIAFIHFVHEDQETIELVNWSRGTLAHYCKAAFDSHYPVSEAGIWADALRQRQPVVYNDYANAAGKRGLPEGHAHLQRLITVPVLEAGLVHMLSGVGNKPEPYTERDVETVRLIAETVWHIVQRRRVAAALQASEQRHRLLADNASDVIWTMDLEGHFTYVSPSVQKLRGFTPEQAMAQTLEQALCPGSLPVAREAMLRSNLGSIERLPTLEFRGELEQTCSDGTTVWTDVSVSGIRNPAGQTIGILGVSRDITAQKRSEAELLRANRRFAALSRCNEAIARSATTTELFERVCHDMVEHGGMTMAWVCSLSAADQLVKPVASCGDADSYLQDITISMDAASPLGQGPTARAMRENKSDWCQDFQHDAHTEAWHTRGALAGWQSSAALPLSRGGKVVGALTLYSNTLNAFAPDIRELLESVAANISFALDTFAAAEEIAQWKSRYEAVINASGQILYDMDTTTRSITYGGDTLRVLGSTPARLTGGLTAWLERIHPDDRDGFRLALEHVITTQQPFHHSYRLRGADDSFLDVQDDGYCVLDSQHNLAQIIGFVVDVTVRKRNEARMAEQMDELRRWQQVTLGREGRVLAIKQEVNSLLTELGRPPRYGQDPTVKP